MNNLERLKEITQMIEDMTDGRQKFAPDFLGSVRIQTDSDAYADLLLRKKTDCHTGEITLSFQAAIRRMGSWMNAHQFQMAADEIQEMSNLLYELEQTTLTVSPEEMWQWEGWIGDRQLRQEQAMDEPAPGLEMG